MPHSIEVFSANCPLCKKLVNEIEAGRCARCQLIVYNLSENIELARSYGVRVVPTVIIDHEVKIEGQPDIPFVCSDETYTHFKERYPLTLQLTRQSDEAKGTSQPTQN
jgi:thioredoxin family protein